jgi:Icc-related predicted phosphoesterase
VKILSVSDTVIPSIYSPLVAEKFAEVDCVISCGDLPYYYQEYIISSLNVPFYFVHGNHDPEVEYSEYGERAYPHGGTNLHHRVVRWRRLLLAGVEGSIRYNQDGIYQHSQSQMWLYTLQLIPGLLWNRVVYGRYLDVFVTHAPTWGIHDGPDFPHIGIKAFRWLIQSFKPQYHLHGHIHVYNPATITETKLGETKILNSYGYKVINVDVK